jgi:hypothetical protein
MPITSTQYDQIMSRLEALSQENAQLRNNLQTRGTTAASPEMNGPRLCKSRKHRPCDSPEMNGPRLCKSRKYRPCDFCRQRQMACKIPIKPPCELCSSHARQCTFVEEPRKKRRPNASNSEASRSESLDAHGSQNHLHQLASTQDEVLAQAWSDVDIFTEQVGEEVEEGQGPRLPNLQHQLLGDLGQNANC